MYIINFSLDEVGKKYWEKQVTYNMETDVNGSLLT